MGVYHPDLPDKLAQQQEPSAADLWNYLLQSSQEDWEAVAVWLEDLLEKSAEARRLVSEMAWDGLVEWYGDLLPDDSEREFVTSWFEQLFGMSIEGAQEGGFGAAADYEPLVEGEEE